MPLLSDPASDNYHYHRPLTKDSLSPMLACTRLPTPAPQDSSHMSDPSSSTGARRMLSVFTSTPASAGITSYAAVNGDGNLPSPLPSPRDGASNSSGSKTAAFFGSPFASSASSAPVPPPAPMRTNSSSSSSEAPRIGVAPPTRSATADFFASNGSGYRPTPPPSVRSGASSREPSPPRLPPLARFFPSRYAAQERNLHDDDTDRYGYDARDNRSPKAGADWETSFKREFMQLTEAATQVASSTPSSPPPLVTSASFITNSPTKMDESPPPAATHLMTPPAHDHRLPSAGSFVTHAKLSEAAHHAHPIRRETHVVKAPSTGLKRIVVNGNGNMNVNEQTSASSVTSTICSGTRLVSGSVALTLVRTLGEGAFSSVWLATDDTPTTTAAPLSAPLRRSTGLRRKSSSWAKRRSDKHLDGIRPTVADRVRDDADERSSGEGSVLLDEQDGEGASAASGAAPKSKTSEKEGRLVAVKMLNRAICDANDRTRISFVREVEVLRHIAHPNIVSYLHSFTTQDSHCLVLEHIDGGELFELVNDDAAYARVDEPAVRRMWGELCRAVGWMHGVNLVHRDIKLENILLTRNIFALNEPLPPANIPLIKLSDFGLSRFIDPASPLLFTRCGSESYAAPELVLGRAARQESSDGSSDSHSEGTPKGYYDGRQTDAWACGVVLFALATRQLPFDVLPQPPTALSSAAPSRTGSVRSNHSGSVRYHRRPPAATAAGRRRDMLMRIAQCEYYWPDEVDDDDETDTDAASTCALEAGEFGALGSDIGAEGVEEVDVNSPAATARRLASPELKSVVRRLLERVPSQRARLLELWSEPWMRGEGAPHPPLRARRSLIGRSCGAHAGVLEANQHQHRRHPSSGNVRIDGQLESASSNERNGYDIDRWANGVDGVDGAGEGEDDFEDLESEEADMGVLLDEDHIASVASQELDP